MLPRNRYIFTFPLFFLFLAFISCRNVNSEFLAINAIEGIKKEQSPQISDELPAKRLSEDFKNYWYGGDAEITSYTLEQSR